MFYWSLPLSLCWSESFRDGESFKKEISFKILIKQEHPIKGPERIFILIRVLVSGTDRLLPVKFMDDILI